MSSEKKQRSIGLFTILFLIFLTLKLSGIGMVATWSWWWVTCPVWLPISVVLILVFLYGAMSLHRDTNEVSQNSTTIPRSSFQEKLKKRMEEQEKIKTTNQ